MKTDYIWLTIFIISIIGMVWGVNPVVTIGASITGVMAGFNLLFKTAR